jgi:catechol 2,3-dioxygenase
MVASAIGIKSVIHPATRLGSVHLTVSNLERSLAFYQRVLGFQVHDRVGDTAHLGAGSEVLLTLTELVGARQVRNCTGLYHFAILTPSRLALAKVLRNLIVTETPFGGSDHLVSEAIYLSDPDGNGIEVYRDRPRSMWKYEHGQIVMDTVPLNYPDILAELKSSASIWEGLQPETVLGHVHLHVANLPQAERFYRDIIGFGLMANYRGSALFFSAGGYHHHLGVNTWAGVDAPPPPPDAVGLRHFVIHLPTAAERTKLLQRLEAGQIAFEEREDGLFVRDPFQNGMLFVVDSVQG